MRKAIGQGLDGAKHSFRWAWRHKIRVAVLALVLVLLAPQPVKTQFIDPCCAIMGAGLSSISSTLSNVIGGGLSGILSIERNIFDFERDIVWPQRLIDEAKGLVGSIQGIYAQIESVTQIAVNSATLASTQQLEQNILSRDSAQIGQTGGHYTAVYGPVPGATSAPVEVRNVIDMTDAVAQAAMKRAIEIDHLATLELEAAERINRSIQRAAPGSAPIIEAQAAAWLIRANAYTQAAIADLMRVRAIDLAGAAADVKSGATYNSALGQQLIDLLKRQ